MISINSQCVACILPCLSCFLAPTSCSSCQPAYLLFNSTCLLSCPNQYYPDNSTSTCQPCDTGCLQCDESGCT